MGISKRKLYNLITMGLILLLIINLFIPIVGDSTKSQSLWTLESNSIRIIILFELIIALLICALQYFNILLDFKFVYFSLGYYFTTFLTSLFSFIENKYISNSKIGLWLGLIVSLGALATTIIGNFMGNEANPKMFRGNGGYNSNQPIGYDQRTGNPIYLQNNVNNPMYNNNNNNQMYNNNNNNNNYPNMGPPIYR